jgi:hypothetical protein
VNPGFLHGFRRRRREGRRQQRDRGLLTTLLGKYRTIT